MRLPKALPMKPVLLMGLFCLLSVDVLDSAKPTVAAAAATDKVPAGKDRPCSFTQPPFVNPRIINELSTWQSDQGEQVVTVNLTDSQESNRYFGQVGTRTRPDQNPHVYFETPPEEAGQPGTEFGYRYIGRTTLGVDVLLTMESGGGSGIFEYLMFLRMEPDNHGPAIVATAGGKRETMTFKKRRVLLRKLGEVALGDRWEGQLKVTGNDVVIGKDTGPMNRGEKSEGRVIKIDFQP